MAIFEASQLLRPALLDGSGIVIVRAPSVPSASAQGIAAATRDACAGLGARVSELELASLRSAELDEPAIERAAEELVAGLASVELIAVDAAGLFAGAGDGVPALARCLEASWCATRALVDRALLAAGRPGRIVLVAPPARDGGDADAATAALENLARTLSIEWARHGITTVTIAPGDATDPREVAALIAYLACPAGAYFSGCLLDLRGT